MKITSNHLFWGLFLLVLVLNFKLGRTIMGFDNASIYYDPNVTTFRVFNSGNFFHFGGLLYSLAFFLSILQIAPWLNSYITYFGALLVGIYFLKKVFEDKNTNPVLTILLPTLGSLVTIWIFSIPILIFVPSFAGVTTLLYIFSKSNLRNVTKLDLPFLIVGLLYFYSTSVNVVAFGIYFLQAVVLSILLGKTTVTDTLKRSAIVLVVWVIITQSLLLFLPNKRNIIAEAISYGHELLIDTKSSSVTDSLRRMEINRNSVVNVSRFATGWIKLTNADDKPLLKFANFIDTPVGLLLTLLPVAFVMFFVLKQWGSITQQEQRFATTFTIGILLSSQYAIQIYSQLPFISYMLRWASSKLWPILFIPWLYLLSSFYKSTKTPLWQKVAVTVCYSIISCIWLFGIVNKNMIISFPREYNVLSSYSPSDRILYVPVPQRLYMRQYTWGYYGSSFAPYISKATIYDGGIFHPIQNDYDSFVRLYISCNLRELREKVDFIIVDHSVDNSDSTIPQCYNGHTKSLNSILTQIDLKSWQK